jgi:Isochorismatase family
MAVQLVNRLTTVRSAVFLCDMQEKFRPSIQFFNEVVFNSSRILKVANLLDMPVICTEQYPRGASFSDHKLIKFPAGFYFHAKILNIQMVYADFRSRPHCTRIGH